MNTTLHLFPSEFDTYSPEESDPSMYHPTPYILQSVPDSDTQPINFPGEGPVISLPVNRVERYFLPEQSWEGMVLEILEDSFRARLVDIENADQQEETEILKTAVTDEDDLKLLVPGAIFFWTIGHRVEGRRSEQVSLIQFRRLPIWTEKEIQEAKREAMEFKKRLGW
jgi:hypothetical protein